MMPITQVLDDQTHAAVHDLLWSNQRAIPAARSVSKIRRAASALAT